MKTKKQWFIFLLTLFIAGISGNANASTEKENRKTSDFNSIHVSTGIDLFLTMGSDEKVTIVADDEIIDDIITEVKNGVLKIYQKNRMFRWNFNKERKAYVTVKTLEKLHASSGSDVISENTITGDELEVRVSSGSDIKIEVEVNSLDLKSSSGSDARIAGKAKYFKADASSGSDIKAQDLKTKNCEVEVSSGSDASVNVSGELIARASSGGDINYYGNPESKDTHESSGGDIRGR
ncbi:MAG: DUF2807 domain-containing protein [Mariniphaga sp.]|nr:DUF2807 domain-containing protein [Mariniphaga sp.]